MEFFGRYLKERGKWLAAMLVCDGVFFLVMCLCRLPLGAAVYPAVLCAAVAAIVFTLDYLQVRQRHKELSCIQNSADVTTRPLPEAVGALEEDYQQVISLLCREMTERREAGNLRYQDMVEYYTMWVHQIKTPIASMHLNLQNEDSPLGRQLSSDLRRIEQYADMVLTFLRLDSESTDYVIKEQDLDAIVRQAVRKFAGEFIARKLKLHYEPLEITIITDEKWLGFVMEQVLSNALKYTVSGGVRIYLRDKRVLCVEDTGIGIAPEDLPRIFEKGYTGYNGRTDKRASGIGLYLCRRICGNLGHEIWAESAPGGGTTVCIRLEQKKLVVE